MQEFAEPAAQTQLGWLMSSLGLKYALLLPLSTVLSMLLVLILLLRGKGSGLGAAVVLAVFIPFLIGVFGALEGAIQSFSVIARSVVAPKPSEIAQGASMALVVPMVGLFFTLPGYALALLGFFVRSVRAQPDR